MNCRYCKNYIKNNRKCSLKYHEPFTNGEKINGETILNGMTFNSDTLKYEECNDFEESSLMNIFDFLEE